MWINSPRASRSFAQNSILLGRSQPRGGGQMSTLTWMCFLLCFEMALCTFAMSDKQSKLQRRRQLTAARNRRYRGRQRALQTPATSTASTLLQQGESIINLNETSAEPAQTSQDIERSGTSSAKSRKTKRSTDALLESLSVEILNVFNLREYDSPVLQRLTEGHTIKDGGSLVASTRDEAIAYVRRRVEENPFACASFGYVSSNVSRNNDRARVWVTHRTTNMPFKDISCEAVKLLTWEVRDGKWMCIEHETIRGLGMCSDEVL